MVKHDNSQSWALACGPIMLTWSRRNYQLKQRSPSMNKNQFIEDLVTSHNNFRQRHAAPPIVHSTELSAIAQKWADKLAQTNTFQHSKSEYNGQTLGENISVNWSSNPKAYSGEDVTNQWYDEVKMYDFQRPSYQTNTGHFTQLVWRVSSQIGVGKAVASDGKVIVVANYFPAGNILGRYPENVIPSEESTTLSNNTQDQRDSNLNFESTSLKSDAYLTNRFGNMSGQSRSVRTYTVTEGTGPNAKTKTIVEETVTLPDGRTMKTKKETVTTQSNSNTFSQSDGFFNDHMTNRFGRLNVNDAPVLNNSKPDGNSSQPQTMNEFRDSCLEAHNTYRQKHQVSPLKLSDDLNRFAQKWAEKLAASGRLQHSQCQSEDGDRLGENVYMCYSSRPNACTGQQVADQWYSEIKNYAFNGARSSGVTGHFTQVVWNGSKELGLGKARTSDGKVFVVASYRPAGNMLGEYVANVFPAKN